MGKDLLELGKVVAIHALKGEIRLQPWCDTPDFAAGFKKVYLDGMREYFSEGVRVFYANPQQLLKKDPDLYEYIKELMK